MLCNCNVQERLEMATLDQDQAKLLEELREFKDNFEVVREVYRKC